MTKIERPKVWIENKEFDLAPVAAINVTAEDAQRFQKDVKSYAINYPGANSFAFDMAQAILFFSEKIDQLARNESTLEELFPWRLQREGFERSQTMAIYDAIGAWRAAIAKKSGANPLEFGHPSPYMQDIFYPAITYFQENETGRYAPYADVINSLIEKAPFFKTTKYLPDALPGSFYVKGDMKGFFIQRDLNDNAKFKSALAYIHQPYQPEQFASFFKEVLDPLMVDILTAHPESLEQKNQLINNVASLCHALSVLTPAIRGGGNIPEVLAFTLLKSKGIDCPAMIASDNQPFEFWFESTLLKQEQFTAKFSNWVNGKGWERTNIQDVSISQDLEEADQKKLIRQIESRFPKVDRALDLEEWTNSWKGKASFVDPNIPHSSTAYAAIFDDKTELQKIR